MTPVTAGRSGSAVRSCELLFEYPDGRTDVPHKRDVANGPEILAQADCVFLDFDGPVCDLFHGNPSAGIARRLRGILREHGASGLLDEQQATAEDPHLILRHIYQVQGQSALGALLERTITTEEIRAARTAAPTPHALPLIEALAAAGQAMAITTNNSASAAEDYLSAQGLLRHFPGRVHGRLGHPGLLKPHPDCLVRALKSTGAQASRTVMIGDAVSDFQAAREAGVLFIGFASRPEKLARLRAAGATYAVTSLEPLVRAARGSTG